MSWWMDEFGHWVHLSCGHRCVIERHVIRCGPCRTARLAPWHDVEEPRMPYWYGRTA